MTSTWVALSLAACGAEARWIGEGDADETDSGISSDTGGDGDDDSLSATTKIDLLVVMDNSASMASIQIGATESVGALVQALIDEQGFDVRVGVTTTDNGNSACAASGLDDTSPEGGKLVASSCTTRAAEFEWPHSDPQVFTYEEACLASCPAFAGDALEIVPTGIEGDSASIARPWIEVAPGDEWGERTNITGVSWQQAIACMLPMGIDGCGFESPLESQYKALARPANPLERSYGFLRSDAQLAILHVTDEADCSANPKVDQLVFGPDAINSPFWTGSSPTSGICWNAGTACTGSGAPYDDCISESYNYLGDETSEVFDGNNSDAQQQVLYPLSRYLDQLELLPRLPVVFALAGVPEGYTEGTADLVYRESAATEEAWGIDFGCTSTVNGFERTALPPVRLREFAEAFVDPDDESGAARPGLGSVCAGSYVPAMEVFRDRIVAAARG